jgi:undecaprenyl-diphosphatase
MDILHAVILSIIEGITEFLPVSSTGHMILAAHLLRISETNFVKSFEIIIQLGSIFAVVVLYWRTIMQNRKAWKSIFFGFLPTAVVGLTVYRIVKDVLLGNVSVTLWALLLGGIALIVVELLHKEKDGAIDKIENITVKSALIIGLFQSLAVIPGVSRSAATIIGAMLLKTKRKTAVEFSFLLAIPTMVAATGLDVIKMKFAFTPQEYELLAVGLFGSFVVALLAIKFFLKYIQKHTFIAFGVYRIILAIVFFFFVH